MTVKVKQGQSLLDIAIQHCGTAESVYDLAIANGLSITDELVPGQLLNLPAVTDKKTVSYFDTNEIKPATAVTAADLIFEGIDYWGIDVDFIVQ
jgi:hypothetical protein